jgi:hypothetical protein
MAHRGGVATPTNFFFLFFFYYFFFHFGLVGWANPPSDQIGMTEQPPRLLGVVSATPKALRGGFGHPILFLGGGSTTPKPSMRLFFFQFFFSNFFKAFNFFVF